MNSKGIAFIGLRLVYVKMAHVISKTSATGDYFIDFVKKGFVFFPIFAVP